MKIVCISDTHGQHAALQLPAGDMILHAGDLSGRGRDWEIRDFLNWFSNLPHKHKVFIGGNHDFLLEDHPEDFKEMIPANVTYLEDSFTVIEGIKIWGSPITPWFFDWAFNRRRGPEIKKHWDKIPEDTDILITHGPPARIRDKTNKGDFAGCEDLMLRIQEVKPKVHLFGHIHEAYGQQTTDGTQFVNASVLNLEYRMVNNPIVIEL